MFKICQGLETHYKNNTVQEDYNDIEELCIKEKNCYLVYNDEEVHKIYFDVDMKKDEYEKVGTYEEVKDDLLNCLKNTLSKYSTLSIAEANKKDYKISYRIVMNDYKMKIKEMKEWIKNVRCEFDDIVKNTIDLMPYMSNGKIRLPHCSKDGEERPFTIIEGKFKDFLTIKTDKATLIDWEEIKPKELNKVIDRVNKVIRKEKISNNKVSDEIMTEVLNNLDYFRCNDYKEWSIIGMALYNDGYDIKLYKDFSRRSKKYTLGCEVKKWQQFKEYDNPISSGSLWYYLSKDNNEKYIELRDKVDSKNYDFKVDLTEDEFDEKQMYKLMIADIKELGLTEYKSRFFCKSKSFQYFNHYIFKVLHSNMVFNIEFKGKRKQINKIDISAFTAFKYEQGTTHFNFVDDWTDSINKQCYSKIDFAPNSNKKNIFNLFNGFNYQDENKDYNIDNIKPLLDHIKYLCNDEEDVYEYILNWISHIVQKPERKTETALVFYSHKEGIGKNIFTTILKKIFDGYVATDMKLDKLVGKFNSNLAGKLLIIADEITPTAKELNNELKNIITRDEVGIEYKGKDVIMMADHSNYIFTTNNENAFRITEEDRRYCMVECPTVKKPLSYFNDLYPKIKDDKIIKQLYNFFLTKDLSGFDAREPPLTEYKKRTQQHNLGYHIKMIIECPENFAMRDIQLSEIKGELNSYCKYHGYYRPNITDRRIMLDMTDKFGKYKKKKDGIATYQMPAIEELTKYIKDTFGSNSEEI
jgi:putative DNA primase/helicase